MSLVLIKEPKAILNTHESDWSAVQMPMEFQFQRKDQNVQLRYVVNGKVVLKVIGNVNYAFVGDRIQYVTSTGIRYNWTIVSISGNNIYTDGVLIGSASGGFVIYMDGKKDYFVETEVFDINQNNQYTSVGIIESRVDTLGIITVNISEWLSSLGEFRNLFTYDQINKAMKGEGGKYQIRQREIFEGSVGANSVLNGVRYWSNSVKQIQEIYGNNMMDFVPTLDDTRDKAKFLTDFVKPTYFVGFPFSLSFIYSNNLQNKQLQRRQDNFDINGVQIGSTLSKDLDYAHRTFVNRVMISDSIPSNVKEIDVWIESGADISGNGVGGGYTVVGVFETVQPNLPNPTTL